MFGISATDVHDHDYVVVQDLFDFTSSENYYMKYKTSQIKIQPEELTITYLQLDERIQTEKMGDANTNTIAIAVCAGLVLGCHLGSYFLTGLALVVVVVYLVQNSKQ